MSHDEFKAAAGAYALVAAQLADHGQRFRDQLTSASGIDEIQRRFVALRSFRDLGHSVDDRPSELDARTGRPQWRCRRCGSDLQLDSAGGGRRPVALAGVCMKGPRGDPPLCAVPIGLLESFGSPIWKNMDICRIQ